MNRVGVALTPLRTPSWISAASRSLAFCEPRQVSNAAASNPAEPANKTAVLLKGDSASLKFDKAGTYEYGCALHPAMKGKIQVGAE